MIRIHRSSPWLAATLMAGLALVGCSGLPNGMLPTSQTPDINTNGGGATTPSNGSTDWRVNPRPATPAPTGPSPTRTPAPVYNPSPVSTPAPTAPATSPAPSGMASLEAYIFQQVNIERGKVGAKPLVQNDQLTQLARSRSQDMIDRNYFDHVTPDGKRVFDMLTAMGYAYSNAGENIGMNSYPEDQSAQQMMQGWMNSSGHKANILNTSYGRIGIGAEKKSDGSIYYTQVFTN